MADREPERARSRVPSVGHARYGVTMAESGISQVAGLRLEDVEAVRRSHAG
jgi:hypothetical protein